LEVGDSATRAKLVSSRDIELFTEMSGDHNPLHYDQDLAEKTQFGGIIVQGGVTTGLLNAIVAEDLPGPGSVFLSVNWKFPAPVRPDDTITARVEILEIRSDKPLTKLACRITNQDDVTVLDGDAVVWTVSLD